MMPKLKLIIIGSSGHAKEVINILEENKQFEIVGCLGSTTTEEKILGYPIFSNIPISNSNAAKNFEPNRKISDEIILTDLFDRGIHHAFVAIGDNHLRMNLYQKIKAMGFKFGNAISSSCRFLRSCQIGENNFVMPGCTISADTFIGNNVIIGAHSYIAHDCIVEDHAHLGPHTAIAGNVKIESGAFLGIGTRVIPGMKIGAFSIVGAGSTVITSIPAHSTAVGVPAKIIKSRQYTEI